MRWLLLGLLVGCHAASNAAPSPPPPPPPVAPLPAASAVVVAAVAVDAGSPEATSYDLAADRERRLALARTELVGKTTSAIVADTFVVIGPPGGNFGGSVALMRSAMAGFLNDRFAEKPAEAITVYLLPDAASYEAICRKKYGAPCIAHFGFYQPGDRSMVMNIGLGVGTLTHELVHPLVEANFPEAPTWLNEGIASVFEQPVITKPGEIHGAKNWRLPRLRAGLAAHELRLDQLFSLSDEAFRADHEDLHYAAARYVCQWLDERGKLWPFFHAWRTTHATDASGVRTFTEVVGMTPVDADVVWARWVAAL